MGSRNSGGQEFACCDRSEGDRLVGKEALEAIEIQLLPLQRNEDTGVDQVCRVSVGTSG